MLYFLEAGLRAASASGHPGLMVSNHASNCFKQDLSLVCCQNRHFMTQKDQNR